MSSDESDGDYDENEDLLDDDVRFMPFVYNSFRGFLALEVTRKQKTKIQKKRLRDVYVEGF